jgi:beta-lactamase superfamily II metal-dependent hydrolase
MKKIFFGFALMLLLFGCIDLGGDQDTGQDTGNDTPVTPPTPPDTVNDTPDTVNDTPVTPPQLNDTTIIVTPQENQTIEQNYTEPVTPPEQKDGINYTLTPEASFAVYFIYVGDYANKAHGDAILIKKGDFEMLVDAGPTQSGAKVVEFLKSRGVDDVDVLVSTNADPYHYGGISTVKSNFQIEELWWSGKAFNDQEYSSLMAGMNNKVKKVRILDRGFNMSINGMEFSALNPKPKEFGDKDNDAIVLRVEDRNFSMVLLSGVQFGAQNEMVNNVKDQLECNVMQAPYYGLGAGTSGIGNFLTLVQPETVVISGGPDDSAASGGDRSPFRRLMDEHKVEYFENFKGGTVRVTSDGKDFAVGYFGS